LLRQAGFALCKVDAGQKRPSYEKWPTYSKEPDDFGDSDLVGILGGPLSNYNQSGHALVVIDLDAEAALTLADNFLPPTLAEGRASRLRSHRYYLVPLDSIPVEAWSTAEQAAPAAEAFCGHPGPKKRQFRDPKTDKVMIDFIGTGGQAVCPPSLHPSGECREWSMEPAAVTIVPYPDLWAAVCKLADACGWRPRAMAAKAASPAKGNGAAGQVDASTLKRARAYLAAMPPAVSSKGGHNQTFAAARAVVYGFDLGVEAGYDLLAEHYNPRCSPPWGAAELWHKCEDAYALDYERPRGWLLDAWTPRRRRGTMHFSFTVEREVGR
jgi:hypothetical protein